MLYVSNNFLFKDNLYYESLAMLQEKHPGRSVVVYPSMREIERLLEADVIVVTLNILEPLIYNRLCFQIMHVPRDVKQAQQLYFTNQQPTINNLASVNFVPKRDIQEFVFNDRLWFPNFDIAKCNKSLPRLIHSTIDVDQTLFNVKKSLCQRDSATCIDLIWLFNKFSDEAKNYASLDLEYPAFAIERSDSFLDCEPNKQIYQLSSIERAVILDGQYAAIYGNAPNFSKCSDPRPRFTKDLIYDWKNKIKYFND